MPPCHAVAIDLKKRRNGRGRSKGAVAIGLTLARLLLFLLKMRMIPTTTAVILMVVRSAIVVHVRLRLSCTPARQTRGRKVSSDCGWLPGRVGRLSTHALKIRIGMVESVLVCCKAPRAWILVVSCRWCVAMVINVVVIDDVFRAIEGPGNGMPSFDSAPAEDRLTTSAAVLGLLLLLTRLLNWFGWIEAGRTAT